MFPFVPPSDLTEPMIDALESVITATRAFEFSLTRVREFEQGVLYLEPEPAEPFAELTKEISRRFGMLPFAGEFGEEPVPHLTVAILKSASRRQQIVAQLRGLLPIVLQAKEAWLMVGSNESSWDVVRDMRFRD
jgi:2'-5' RNA ligase